MKPETISVEKLLQNSPCIPQYQRPYKWTQKNVRQLISDIVRNKEKSEYRLGTIVIHDGKDDKGESSKSFVVDGQQRLVTLLLIAHALNEHVAFAGKDGIKKAVKDFSFPNNSDISAANIRKNYAVINSQLSSFDEEVCKFLLERCTFVKVVTEDLGEAFQFFDSQNSRGKALAPHDLLKAFHLREMRHESAEEKNRVIAEWEAAETEELINLFATYLYRIRNWVRGESARYFGKDDIDHFKGIPATELNAYPFARAMHITDCYVRDYNNSINSAVHTKMPYPFQMDQPIINGVRFFEMVAHYLKLFRQLRDAHNLQDEIEHYRKLLKKVTEGTDDENLNEKQHTSIIESWKLNGDALRIMHALATYSGRGRTGDQYTRVLFDCCLAYYIDKFGISNISQAIKVSFHWAYSLRLTKQRVQMASMDNHALGQGGMFKNMYTMLTPDAFLQHPLTDVGAVQANGVDALKSIFDKPSGEQEKNE